MSLYKAKTLHTSSFYPTFLKFEKILIMAHYVKNEVIMLYFLQFLRRCFLELTVKTNLKVLHTSNFFIYFLFL